MTVARRPSHSVCHVLLEDPELAEAIPAARRERATHTVTAPVLMVSAGDWDPVPAVADERVTLLVLEGLLVRRVGVDGRYGAELLGQGDLIRPWEEDGGVTLNFTTGWRVLEPMRLAVLDADFQQAAARYPALVDRLLSRSLQRARHLAVIMAIIHQARVDVRLHMLFWHLASRWGRVRGDGVLVPLRLTHAVLAEIVAARRPTVTSALSKLNRRGVVRAAPDGWLLSGNPPGGAG